MDQALRVLELLHTAHLQDRIPAQGSPFIPTTGKSLAKSSSSNTNSPRTSMMEDDETEGEEEDNEENYRGSKATSSANSHVGSEDESESFQVIN